MTGLLRLLDVRPAEARPVLATFGSLLFIVVAHTTLETVRDATFLVHIGAGALGYMYILTAAGTLAVGAISSRIGARFGVRRALVATQIGSALGAAAFFFLPPTRLVLTTLYGFSAVSGALLVPQLWVATAALFHAGQSRRLFGTIAIAGVLGALLGTLCAVGALAVLDLKWLYLVSALAFLASTAFIRLAPRPHSPARTSSKPRSHGWVGAFREEPFLGRVAVVVVLGAMTTVFVDYLFKSVAAATIPPDELGPFFARTYAAMNALALVVQLFIARRVLSRAGVVGTATVMPALIQATSILGFLSGGALTAVVATRFVDGAFRHSVHRTGLELLYHAVPASARDRARPIIDGAITRLAQAGAAALVLLLVQASLASARTLALVAMCGAVAWVAASVALRRPYLALFRRALLGDDALEPRTAEELDLANVELLIETLSSRRARDVVAAMDALARRGRTGLIPALVLLRKEQEVIERALSLFASTPRGDWIEYASDLLSDPRDRVRRAAMRALARARRAFGADVPETLSAVDRPWIRGYLAIDALAHSDGAPDPLSLSTPDEEGREATLGMLTALSDQTPDPRLAEILVRIADRNLDDRDAETVTLIARAAASVRATALVPKLIELLALPEPKTMESVHRSWAGPRDRRAVLRASLAALGPPAFDHLVAKLREPATSRLLRMHLPQALAEFGSQQAADILFDVLLRGDDGLVRFRCLRALERMAEDLGVRLDYRAARAAARRELAEYFRLGALRLGLDPTASQVEPDHTRGVVLGLLDDKRKQALVRVFALLKLCFPSEDLRHTHSAAGSADAATRANAMEFLDALLAHRQRSEDGIRALLRLVTEDLPEADRLRRAIDIAPEIHAPTSAKHALELLRADPDPLLASFAASLFAEQGLPDRRTSEPPADAEAFPGAMRPLGAI